MIDVPKENGMEPVFDVDELPQISEKEATERSFIEGVVNKLFPEPNFEELVKGVTIEDKDEEVFYSKRDFKDKKEYLINTVFGMGIKQDEVEEYLSILFSTTVKLESDREYVPIVQVSQLSAASESLEKAKFWVSAFDKWKEEFINEDQDDTVMRGRINEFMREMEKISASNTGTRSNRPPFRSIENSGQMVDISMQIYQFCHSLENESYSSQVTKDLLAGKGIIQNDKDYERVPEKLENYLDLAKNILTTNPKFFGLVVDRAARYAQNHKFSETNVIGFEKKIALALESGDEQVKPLVKPNNSWGMKKDDFGIADFVCHAYCQKVTPENLNDLMMITREVPTTDFARFEQNRKDALLLRSPFQALRDFIHDQRPGVHEVLVAMVDYYESGDDSKLKELLPKAEGYLSAPDRTAHILNKDNYERIIETESAIDILKRLVKNTEPVVMEAPVTSDLDINEKIAKLLKSKKEKEFIPDDDLEQLLGSTNQKLIDWIKKGEIGIEPNMVLALSLIERQGFEKLQAMSFENQNEVHKKFWFKELLKFQELTASPSSDFDEADFENFLATLSKVEARGFDSAGIVACKLIGERVMNNLYKLAAKYRKEGKTERVGALWSGNVAHELIGMIDLRKADSVYGKRRRDELSLPWYERLNGD